MKSREELEKDIAKYRKENHFLRLCIGKDMVRKLMKLKKRNEWLEKRYKEMKR